MSTATAEVVAPKKGNKKLIVIGAAVALLLALAGVGGALLLNKKAPADGDEEGAASHQAAPKAAAAHDPKHPPVFVPLDSFTVNLADRDAERYAQVGITLEVDDSKVGDQVKIFMPAIRNNILMALAEKSAHDLMDREGKTKLAEKIRRETSRALGYEVDELDDEEAEADDKPKKKGKKRKAPIVLPIVAVHFSNFIIQ